MGTGSMGECDKCRSRSPRLVTNDARVDGTVRRTRECQACGHRWSSIECRVAPDQRVLVVPASVARAIQERMLQLLELFESITYRGGKDS